MKLGFNMRYSAVILMLLTLTVNAREATVNGSTASGSTEIPSTVKVESRAWGETTDGKPVTRYRLVNRHGHSVGLTDWGATLLEVMVPDRDGSLANVNLMFDALDGYLDSHPHFGGTIGRFANRIAKGHFEIDGKGYDLAVNNGPNHLHGGEVSYDHRL